MAVFLRVLLESCSRRIPVRARNIKPSLFTNELLAYADPLYTVIFSGLWCIADREGRLEDRPQKIHMLINPGRPFDTTSTALAWLKHNLFIDRYESGGIGVIQITNFGKHQNPHVRESASVLPSHNLGNGQTHPRNGSARLIPDSPSRIPDTGFLIPEGKSATSVADRREEAKTLWPRVIAAVQHDDLRKSFPEDGDVQKAVNAIGGWKKIGLKPRDLRGQTEQAFLNAYVGL